MYTRWAFAISTAAFCFALSNDLFAVEQPSSERAGTAEVVEPADVYRQVQQLQAELEVLRSHMGRPARTLELTVASAAPREVYFQALTLFRKADQLAFEHVQKRTAPPARLGEAIEPRHVLAVIEASAKQIRTVKQHYEIDAVVELPPRDPVKTPSDVFMAIVTANRQLNELLDQPFSPSDVYQQMARANIYASRLIQSLPGKPAVPELPDFESGKVPADVYGRLLECYASVQASIRAMGLTTLDLRLPDEMIDEMAPSDVYDIASLIVSELAYLHELHDDVQPPDRVFFPGRKFPSHVYQQAGLLQRQLKVLQDYVEDHPDWLKKGNTE